MKNIPRSPWIATLAVTALAYTGVLAQDEGGTGDADPSSLNALMDVKVEHVTTASKKAEKATEAPATVLVITASDITLRGYATLKDVLRDLPGMETIESYFSEFGTQVPVRGINGNNKIVILVNGMRVNPPGGEAFPIRSDFSVRFAERIEVIYGPGSTLYGQDAISCVINVITKQATSGISGELGGGAGLNNARDGWGGFNSILDKDGKVRLSGYVQYHDSEMTRLDKEYPRWWQPYRELAEPRNSGTIPSRQDFGLNQFLRLDIYDSSLQVWNRSSRRSSSETGYPPAFVDEAIWEDESTVVEGRNQLRLSPSIKLDSVLTYNRYEIDPSTRYVFPVPGLPNSWFLNDFKYGRGESYSIEETVYIDLSPSLSLVAGGVASKFKVIPKSTVPGGADPDRSVVAQGGTFDYTVPGDPAMQQINRVTEEEYESYAGYAELGWKIRDDLRAVGGVRLTHDTRLHDTPFTPRAALIYDINDHWTAKYIYTKAYIAPAPYFANATYDNGQLLATSNPDIDAEESETHEINLSLTREKFNISASVYYGEQSDIILVSDEGLDANVVVPLVYLNGDASQPRKLVQSVNSGESSRWGADIFGRARFGNASMWASYSYVDFELDSGGYSTELMGASTHNGRLGLTWAAMKKLSITTSLVLRSTPENVPGGALENELDTPYQVDLYALWQQTPNVAFYLDVRNLTDNHYALAGFGNNGLAIPQETLHGTVGIRATF